MFITTQKLNSFHTFLFYFKRKVNWWKKRMTFNKNTIKFG